jgi:hypothetical protein
MCVSFWNLGHLVPFFIATEKETSFLNQNAFYEEEIILYLPLPHYSRCAVCAKQSDVHFRTSNFFISKLENKYFGNLGGGGVTLILVCNAEEAVVKYLSKPRPRPPLPDRNTWWASNFYLLCVSRAVEKSLWVTNYLTQSVILLKWQFINYLVFYNTTLHNLSNRHSVAN